MCIRDRSYDCWGLLSHFYSSEFGINLPSFSEQYSTTEDGHHLASLVRANREESWIEVPKGSEDYGDGVLMTLNGLPRHVGVVVGVGLVLHIERNAGSIIEPYDSHKLKRRVIGFFRHKERLAQKGFSKDESISTSPEGT